MKGGRDEDSITPSLRSQWHPIPSLRGQSPWQSDALDCCGFRHLPRAERYARNDREIVGQTFRFAKARLLYLPDTMPVTGL